MPKNNALPRCACALCLVPCPPSSSVRRTTFHHGGVLSSTVLCTACSVPTGGNFGVASCRVRPLHGSRTGNAARRYACPRTIVRIHTYEQYCTHYDYGVGRSEQCLSFFFFSFFFFFALPVLWSWLRTELHSLPGARAETEAGPVRPLACSLALRVTHSRVRCRVARRPRPGCQAD